MKLSMACLDKGCIKCLHDTKGTGVFPRSRVDNMTMGHQRILQCTGGLKGE